MNIIEPLNHDAVISLDNASHKFHSASCTFCASEMRQFLFNNTSEPQDKWFGDGVPCKALRPNCSWRTGRVMFQVCFRVHQLEDDDPDLLENEPKSKSTLFEHSMGLLTVLDNATVVSLQDWNDKYGDTHGTFLSSEIRESSRQSYRRDEAGYKWFSEGVPCAVLTPNQPWRKGVVTLQVGFIEDVIEEELIVVEQSEARSDETTVDVPIDSLSPLDEIRHMMPTST
jgi:KGK domain